MQFIKTKSKQALYLYVLQHKFQPSIYQSAYLLILIFLNSFMIQALAIAGACDMIIDYRKRINNSQN